MWNRNETVPLPVSCERGLGVSVLEFIQQKTLD